MEGEWLTKQDVARILKCSLSTIDRWKKKGILPEVKVEGNRSPHGPGRRLVRFDATVVSGLIHH